MASPTPCSERYACKRTEDSTATTCTYRYDRTEVVLQDIQRQALYHDGLTAAKLDPRGQLKGDSSFFSPLRQV
jgi:hypothetical protein